MHYEHSGVHHCTMVKHVTLHKIYFHFNTTMNMIILWTILIYVNYIVFISRPRVARAGTNKLKCQKNLPTGSHLNQISAGVPNLDETLNLNNFGQNGQNWKLFVAIIKPARWGFRGKKSFFDFDLFWPRSGQNREPTLKSAPKYGTFASFFGTPNFDTW